MTSKSKPYLQVGIFILFAVLLVWLGNRRPRMTATGPVIVVRQGSNVSFESRNDNAAFWVSRMRSPTNTSAATNFYAK